MTKTTTRKADIVKTIALTLAHQEIGKGFAAYRINQDIDGQVLKKEGLAKIEDLNQILSGELELRDLPEYPILKRDDYQSGLIAVGPSFLDFARDYGFGSNPDLSSSDEGPYDKKRWVETPLTFLEQGKAVHFIEFFTAAHQLFDLEGVPVPVCISFNYIDGGAHNGNFKLKKLVKILSERADVQLALHGGQRAYSWGNESNEFIGSIPGYNADEDRDQCVMFFWRPGVEDYQKMWAHALGGRECQGDSRPGSWDLRWAVMDLDILGISSAMKKRGRKELCGRS